MGGSTSKISELATRSRKQNKLNHLVNLGLDIYLKRRAWCDCVFVLTNFIFPGKRKEFAVDRRPVRCITAMLKISAISPSQALNPVVRIYAILGTTVCLPNVLFQLQTSATQNHHRRHSSGLLAIPIVIREWFVGSLTSFFPFNKDDGPARIIPRLGVSSR
jgi:hypothetical protein